MCTTLGHRPDQHDTLLGSFDFTSLVFEQVLASVSFFIAPIANYHKRSGSENPYFSSQFSSPGEHGRVLFLKSHAQNQGRREQSSYLEDLEESLLLAIHGVGRTQLHITSGLRTPFPHFPCCQPRVGLSFRATYNVPWLVTTFIIKASKRRSSPSHALTSHSAHVLCLQPKKVLCFPGLM